MQFAELMAQMVTELLGLNWDDAALTPDQVKAELIKTFGLPAQASDEAILQAARAKGEALRASEVASLSSGRESRGGMVFSRPTRGSTGIVSLGSSHKETSKVEDSIRRNLNISKEIWNKHNP